MQELAKWMPLILINPVVSKPAGEQVGSEGCLSIPEVNAQVRRAAQVSVRAQTLGGKDSPLLLNAPCLLSAGGTTRKSTI